MRNPGTEERRRRGEVARGLNLDAAGPRPEGFTAEALSTLRGKDWGIAPNSLAGPLEKTSK